MKIRNTPLIAIAPVVGGIILINEISKDNHVEFYIKQPHIIQEYFGEMRPINYSSITVTASGTILNLTLPNF